MSETVLKDILKAQKLVEKLQAESGVVTITQKSVWIRPEGYLKLFPDDRKLLRGVQPVPGVFVTLAQLVDGVTLYTRISTVSAREFLPDAEGGQTQEVVGAATQSEGNSD